ncbi:hypothetical protein [Natrinema salaciae]|uniref:Uncharacterized protein n=1 Tax=Natrinema salaciae TaxID=1186196 RepID=A0A1H9C956_9EURY|nr:hypothetical protein [Natrinema salaciae]SEP97692.1 hypothetical protein SAMN04489841_0985 [Natrinema salaciae]
MNDSAIVGGCLAVAVLLAGIVSVVTETTAVLGLTPVGFGVYFAVGIGLPQFLLYRNSGSSLQLGLSILAVVGAAVAVIAGVVTGAPHDEWGLGLVTILLVVVVGNLLGAVTREFRAGFRSGT